MTARLTAAVAFGLAGCSATGAPPVNTANTYTPTTTSVAAAPIPQPADFRIDVIVTDKQCFGPASCVYHYAIDPWPTATFPAQPSGRKLTVVYTVTGGDQDQIGNYIIDFTGDHMATSSGETTTKWWTGRMVRTSWRP